MSRLTLEEIIHFLLEAPMFGDLDPTELSEVVHIMQVQGLRPGQYVFREGDPGDAWYVLYEGEVEVLKEGTLERREIVKLGPLACFGEMAILDGSVRSASVRATTEATAFRFPRADFQRLLEDDNLAAYKLIHQMALVLVARQRETTSRLAELLESQGDLRAGIEPIALASMVTE
jgi:sigma-B regulation protein RsbU (phosphoserine phosphatase)